MVQDSANVSIQEVAGVGHDQHLSAGKLSVFQDFSVVYLARYVFKIHQRSRQGNLLRINWLKKLLKRLADKEMLILHFIQGETETEKKVIQIPDI